MHSPFSHRRAGFSLVEVNLALLVAAGGLMAVFGLFPAALRQSAVTKSELTEFTFAGSLLEAIAGNVRQIDDITVWNDPAEWWKAATSGLNISSSLTAASSFQSSASVSEPLQDLVDFTDEGSGDSDDNKKSVEDHVWYVTREEEDAKRNTSGLSLPPQFCIRVVAITRYAKKYTGESSTDDIQIDTDTLEDMDGGTAIALPTRYLVSVISTDMGSPAIFATEPVYAQEYAFVHRP